MCQTSGESRFSLKGDGPFKAEGAGGGRGCGWYEQTTDRQQAVPLLFRVWNSVCNLSNLCSSLSKLRTPLL